MEAALSMLGKATVLLASISAVLALVILVLYEARYIVRLGLRLCALLGSEQRNRRGDI
jgi:hypothetical protein